MIGEFFIIKKRIEKHIKDIFTGSNDKVLDLGCGKYPYYHRFLKGKITCFDIEKSNKTHLVGNADADFLPFKRNSFDKVIAVNSLYYFRNPSKVAGHIAAILKKNGKLAVITPFFYPIHDAPADKYRFTEFGLKTLLEDHFKVEKICAIGGIFNLPAVILHSLIKGLPMIATKPLKKLTKMLAYMIFYMPYILAQLFSILDAFDKTGRFPTYYIAIATKK